jgi:hypothetical protein
MSREIKTSPNELSIDPDRVPEGKMLVAFLLPLSEVAALTLGTTVTITLPGATK